MKSALSLTLVVCLVASALPVTAQAQMERPGSFDLRGPASQTTAGPLARAVTREAVRLAADGASPAAEAVPAGKRSGTSDWSRVRKLARGTEIIVTVKGSTPSRRYFIAAESGLTVLNMADPALPAAARDVLRDAAPEYFLAAQKGGQFVLEKNVRVGPDGVFVGDRKVAELGQVVENFARTDIVEIAIGTARTRGSAIWSSVQRHAGIGFGVGAGVGLMMGLASRSGECGSGGCVPVFAFGGALMGAEIGAINGALIGATTGKTPIVIYRAP